MKAMILSRLGSLAENPKPLDLADRPDPVPGPGQVLVKVRACGVCHTELDEIEGRTPPPRLPVILGHQVVGRVSAVGPEAEGVAEGDRVGLAWIHSACGHCAWCRRGDDNLCPQFLATGRDVDGGYAQFALGRADYLFKIPDGFTDETAAPLLCAGAIGYRSLRLAGVPSGGRLGLTGFGASAHLVLQMARFLDPALDVYVFARSPAEQAFARELGAVWAGDTRDPAPEPLEAIIDTTPAWTPVVAALKNLAPGGRLVINAIRKENRDRPVLGEIDYARDLWMEREIKSVANVAKRDVADFLGLATRMNLRPEVRVYGLADANQALLELKTQAVRGAKVLVME